jgi:hypothetical protein
MSDNSNEILATLKAILESMQRQEAKLDFISGFEARMQKRQSDMLAMSQRLSDPFRRGS